MQCSRLCSASPSDLIPCHGETQTSYHHRWRQTPFWVGCCQHHGFPLPWGISVLVVMRGIQTRQTSSWNQLCSRKGARTNCLHPLFRWCNQELCPVARALENSSYEAKEVLMDSALVYEGSPACGSRLWPTRGNWEAQPPGEIKGGLQSKKKKKSKNPDSHELQAQWGQSTSGQTKSFWRNTQLHHLLQYENPLLLRYLLTQMQPLRFSPRCWMFLLCFRQSDQIQIVTWSSSNSSANWCSF